MERYLYLDSYFNCMPRGRPVKSEIRRNIAEILAHIREGYGYEIAKIYLAIFPKVSRRVIYYHLKKGVQTGEFVISKIEKETGEYSWGGVAEKTYYSLGEKAELRHDNKVKEYFEKESTS